MKNIKTKNFVWNTLGSLVFGFTSLIFMILITRMNGTEDAGVFTYAFACASIFWTIGTYSGKTYQVTENNPEITDSDYLYHRLFTCIIMNLCAVIFCIITKEVGNKRNMILLLTFYRSIDAFIECIHAIVQRNHELYKVGISLFFRTILLVITFFTTNYLFQNMIVATIFLIVINLIYMVVVDYKNIRGKYTRAKFSRKRNRELLKAGFASFAYLFLSIYVVNSTKYAMNFHSTNELQAIFGIIIMPASFLSLIATYIVQPFLNTMTEKINKNKRNELKKLLYQLFGAIFVLGGFSILICYFMGIPVLEFVYGVSLGGELNHLLIILVGSCFYSLATIMSAMFVAMRKTGTQLILLMITAFLSLILSNHFVLMQGIQGAATAYTLVMMIEAVLHFFVLNTYLRETKNKISIRLMGGLGNQMFEYCALRSKMLEEDTKGIISLKGITNKTHNVYSLNHFSIAQEIEIQNKETIKSKVNYLFYGFYYVFLLKRKWGFQAVKMIQPLLNTLGLFCVPDGYIKLKKSNARNQVMVGYYQSLQYFNEYKDILKKELKVKDKIEDKNKKLWEEICEKESVCIHVRRGDYVGTAHQVCTEKYYQEAVNIMKEKVKKPEFYVFSDDISWVKENLKLGTKVTYVEGNNPNYEELRLMYSCKHFIISNSSFSWWAQYLTENPKRITIAPSKWNQNECQRIDIYEDDWILIDVDETK